MNNLVIRRRALMANAKKPYLTVEDFYGDQVAYNIAVTNWGSGGVVTEQQLANVSTIGDKFKRSAITDLRWIKYFSSITLIPNNAFLDCSSIGDCGNVDWPLNLTDIGEIAFYRCYNLAFTSLPSGLTSIGAYAFYRCSNLALTSLPSGLTSIEGAAFTGCSNLALTSLPSGVTSIGTYAFSECSNLALTSLPSGVTSIGIYAFTECSNLALTSLPSGVTSIGDSAFSGCSSIVSLLIENANPPALGSNNFTANLAHIYVPAESVDAYKAASGWSAFASKIEAIP